MGEEQWYSNKELYEMIDSLKDELLETRRVVKEYNELRRTLNAVVVKVDDMEKKGQGKKEVADNIRLWGGWAVAILVFLWAIASKFI